MIKFTLIFIAVTIAVAAFVGLILFLLGLAKSAGMISRAEEEEARGVDYE